MEAYPTEKASPRGVAPRAVSPMSGSIQSSEPSVKSDAPVAKETATQYGTEYGRKPEEGVNHCEEGVNHPVRHRVRPEA